MFLFPDVCESIICGRNANCISSNHTAGCVCREGYIGDPNNINVGCSPKPTPCHTTTDCPANTYCYGDICRCKYCVMLYVRLHFTCCVMWKLILWPIVLILTRCHFVSASCLMDEECGLSEKCNQGQCLNPCDQHSTCGLNADCASNNHVVQCSCPAGFTGNQEVECVRSKFLTTK